MSSLAIAEAQRVGMQRMDNMIRKVPAVLLDETNAKQ